MSIFTKASGNSYWRGYHYYKDNRVKDIKKISDDIFAATVIGSKEYDVRIDLSHPLKSSCTCPFVEGNHKICKHMVALGFATSPKELLEAKEIEKAYYQDIKDKKTRYQELLSSKEKEIKEYVDSLSNDQLKEELYRRLLNLERDRIYDEVYGDDEYDDEYDDEFYYEDKLDGEDEDSLTVSNGITDWKVGDKIHHLKFGSGIVTKVEDNNILEVKFDNGEFKTVIGSHYMISRIEK